MAQERKSPPSGLENIKETVPNVGFVIERSKNKNTVVYELHYDKEGNLDKNKAISVYWLDIDPDYVAAARKKGKKDDREELNMIENSMAYGLTCKATQDPKVFDLILVALPDRKVQVVLLEKSKAVVKLFINKIECALKRIYVFSVEGWFKPTVKWIEIQGKALADEKPVSEIVVLDQ